MKYYLTKQEAEDAAEQYNYLLGQKMLKPYESYPITSITVEKAKKNQGFIVILSHDVFDGGWPEITGFRCPQVELDDFLNVTTTPFL
jgi:hypothetical protein